MLWGNALIKHIRMIQVTQNKCVGAICGENVKSPSSPIFKQLGILRLQDIYELHTNVFIFNFVNGGLPNPLLGIYQYHRDIHEHNTRQSTDPRTPNVNSEKVSYIRVQICGNHWMIVCRVQKLSRRSKDV